MCSLNEITGVKNKNQNAVPSQKARKTWAAVKQHKFLYLLAAPALIYFAVFKFGPMWGLLMAFKDYSPYKGIFGSPWIGVKLFQDLFKDPFFFYMLRNTVAIAMLKLFFYFPVPIFLAIMLNEVRHNAYRKLVQTVVYFPHFLSWVITASLTVFALSANMGFVNKILASMGKEQILFLVDPNYFWPIVLIQSIWKEAGWGTIIFMAALVSIDLQLYEAALIDGATRLQRIWHVTLPGLLPTIVVLLILRLGQIFDVGFEQIFLMQNSLVRDVSEIFDTYSYSQGILQGQYSLGAAVGFFKSCIGLIFLTTSNYLVKKSGNEGIF